jgi:hypothetical protein
MIFLSRKVNRAVTFQYQKGVDAYAIRGRSKIWERRVSMSVAIILATVVIQQCDQSSFYNRLDYSIGDALASRQQCRIGSRCVRLPKSRNEKTAIKNRADYTLTSMRD